MTSTTEQHLAGESGETMNQAPSEWLPIETAPKDGTYILLGNEYGTWVGKYEPVFASGYRPESPWQSMMLNHRHMVKFCSSRPTDWQPLPAPPISKGSGKRLKSIEETRELSLSAPVDMTPFNAEPDIDVPVKRRVPPIAGIYEAGIGIRRGGFGRD